MPAMEISGVCERCGIICNIVYAKSTRRGEESDQAGTLWTISVTCPKCGRYNKRPYSIPKPDNASERNESLH
jgi:hypothetical protein